MRPVYFVKYYDKASTILSADQIAEGLAARGHDSRSIYARESRRLRDSVLVFIKKVNWPELLAAKVRNNSVVVDVQDTVVFRRFVKWKWLVDGLIFKNERQREDFSGRRSLSRVIHHQWDPRLEPNRSMDCFRVGFLGHPRSMPFWHDLDEVEFVGNSDFLVRAGDFSAHLSVRRFGREWNYKTNSKAVTAAGCRAVLLSTPDVATVEELGPNYPYYCEPTLASVRALIARARAEFGGESWRKARAALDALRERRSLDAVLDDYVAFFDGLEARRLEAR